MKLYGQNRRISIVEIEAILLFNVVGLMLRPTFEDGWYELTYHWLNQGRMADEFS